MKPRYIHTAIAIVSALLFITSCKTARPALAPATRVEDKANSQLFEDVLSHQPDFRTLSSKMDITLSMGRRSLSSKATLKMRKDYALQISLQPLFGVEVMRLYLNPDTIVVLDRMNKRYVKEALKDVKKEYPVGFDFFTLQSLFANSVFVADAMRPMPEDYTRFKMKSASNAYLLQATDATSHIDYEFTINGNDRVSQTRLMQSDEQRTLQWEYANFVMINEKLAFPLEMNVIAGSPSHKVQVDMSLTNPVFNEGIEFSGTIPVSYQRMGLQDVIRIIANM